MRIWIDKGYYLQPRELEHAGHSYMLSLEFQVFEVDGAPTSGSYKGPGSINGRVLVVGDDQNSGALLTEYVLSSDPTSESKEYYLGFLSGLKAKRQASPDKPTKDTYGMSSRWWEGHNDAWREKRENAGKMAPNARPQPAKVVIRRAGSRWEAKMYDSAGHLRSSVSGSDMVAGSKYISGKQYVEGKIKEHWPDLPVEYEDDEMNPNADLEWIKGSGVDSDGHSLAWWKSKLKKWKGEWDRPRAELQVACWDRRGQRAQGGTYSLDQLTEAKAFAKEWSKSSGSAEVRARIEIPHQKNYTIDIGEYRNSESVGFYVWSVDKDGVPFDKRGPWEKDYEAVGQAKVSARASNQFDFVVTFGGDPEATDFEIVKAFKAWSGEVHYGTDLPRVGGRLREYR